jgi:hypothetical protein
MSSPDPSTTSAGRTLIIRYRTTPEAAEENRRLVAAVFASLAELKPPGFSYSAYQLADGVSFVHVSRLNGPDNPLGTLPTFAEFQRQLAQRCVEQPSPSQAAVVGSYTSTP